MKWQVEEEGGQKFGHTSTEEIFMVPHLRAAELETGTLGIFRSIPAHS